jgi:Zn-dependent protease with chaperone function
MSELYPPGPAGVPPELTQPTRAYQLRAWLAMASLVLFVALYVGLTYWFGRRAFDLFTHSVSTGDVVGMLLSLVPAFFFVFLVKGLFFVRRGSYPGLLEVTAEDQPDLLAFIDRVADESGARRPHRVYLSPRVNAGVFYDLTVLNLLVPSRKNLEVGLGLVNALTLDELKAVVAHEFGHFAQRTMAVGRWVYLARQVVGQIVARRDALDELLDFLSRIDLRVAWVGWIMKLLVWALRAVVDTAFQLIALAEHALSREMELQADLVSVSLCGSDSLVHALHRLAAADDAWGRAATATQGELARERPPEDFFAVQTAVQQRMGQILDDPTHGEPPPLPSRDPAAHRVFRQELAHPPQMWSTHPPNREREDNVKRHYIASPADPRPAWVLFRDPDAVRRRMTRHLLEQVTEKELPPAVPVEETLTHLDEMFDQAFLDPRYRGTYLHRSVVRFVPTREALYGTCATDRDGVIAQLDALYPESLSEAFKTWRNLEEEAATLQALKDGILDAPGGVIRHRGREIPRKQLATLITEVEAERDAQRRAVIAHDRACRTAHRAAARILGQDWEAHLVGLASLVHYGEHLSAELSDAVDYLRHVFAIVTADGRVSASEMRRLAVAAEDLYRLLGEVFEGRERVVLCAPVREAVGVEEWSALLPDCWALEPPNAQNIQSWLEVIDSWIEATEGPLGALAEHALASLVRAEDHVATCLRDGTDPGPAPAPATIPADYPKLVPGEERERQLRLGWWDRFLLADGFVPGGARLAVAAALLFPALYLGGRVGNVEVAVHNGLGTQATVEIGPRRVQVPPMGHTLVRLPGRRGVPVQAHLADGRPVEQFEVDLDSARVTYVYNVAGASALYEWTAVYGGATPSPEKPLGAPVWMETDAPVVFVDPPLQVETRYGGATRRVVWSRSAATPARQAAETSTEETRRMALAHARWDPPGAGLLAWLDVLGDDSEAGQAFAKRLAAEPHNVHLLRIEQEATVGEQHEATCVRHRRLAESNPDSADLQYIGVRCIADDAERDEEFQALYAQYPDNLWLAYAAGFGHEMAADWAQARAVMEPAAAGLTSLMPGIELEIARIRRAASPEPDTVKVRDLLAGFAGSELLLVCEPGNATPPDLEPLCLVAKGDLRHAVQQAEGELVPHVIRLAAASEGADPELVKGALSLRPDRGIGWSTLLASIALAAREGRPVDVYRSELDLYLDSEQADAVWALTDAAAVRADPSLVDVAVARLPMTARGQVRVMGLVLLDYDGPSHWRHEAKALLFRSERPFIR